MRVIPYILYLLLVAMHVVIWRDITSIYGVTVSLSALLVVLVALYKDFVTAAWFGFFAGLVSAAALPHLLGWYALIMAGLAVAVSYTKEQLNLDTIRPRLLLVAGGILLYNLVSLGVSRSGGFLTLSWTSAVLGAAYTTLIAWLFFLVKEGVITVKKIKSIF
jgi:rod shape-determining protein MreD